MRKLLLGVAIVIATVFLWNTSWLAAPPDDPQIRVIAHRGVHQTFDRSGLENDTCTATRIHSPEHVFLENTLPSMQAAFAAGADIVEIDVHPTTDGHLAVFHDWTLDCRTNGAGVTRDHNMAYLKTLDIGYGYTADNGATWPFRGKGLGQMPELTEIFATFPDGKFLINYKSREAREGDMLAAIAEQHPEWRGVIWSAYGGAEPTDRANALIPDLNGFSSRGMKDCLVQYVALGWTGYVPEACRDTHVMIPVNFAWAMWGWPHRLHRRLAENGSDIILIGPVEGGDVGTSGIDSAALLAAIPEGFDGYIWTNRAEKIGPLVKGR